MAAADIYARTSGPARKAGGPALAAALTFASVLALSAANQLLVWENDRLVLLLYDLAICVVALVLAADLLWGRWTEATVADFVTQLGARPDLGTLAGALQRALGDPTVALGYWLPDQHRYVDDAWPAVPAASGRSDPDCRSTSTSTDEPVAVLIQDAAIQQDEQLLADVTAALRLALGNARLRAQVRANLSRARHRAAAPGRGGRRSAQAAGIRAGRRAATPAVRDVPTPRERRRQPTPTCGNGSRPCWPSWRLRRPSCAIWRTASGLPHWSRAGWPPRFRCSSGRPSRTPVDLTVTGGRLPPAVEGAVYFVCAEALTNIAKHADATRASVAVTVDHGAVVARIVDDGCGGADRNGSGLRGLADRVEALGGGLSIGDRAREAPNVMARIPLEEASMRLVIADDSLLVREGLARLLERGRMRDHRHSPPTPPA